MPSCIVVGEGTLTIECCKKLLSRGFELRAVVSDAAELAQWASENGVRQAPLGAGSGADWDLEQVDYLFSIVNLTVLDSAALALARIAAINFHDGPLPRYAGLNTTSWAILGGETEHAVTWHLMRDAVDSGEILLVKSVEIDPHETAVSLNTKCFGAGLTSFEELLEGLERSGPVGSPQPGGARRLFHRSMRPAGGGALDPRRSAAELSALARSLDFGQYPNPFCLPHLSLGGVTLLVDRIATGLEGSAPFAEGPVGEVIAVDDTIRLRVGDGEVRLSGFRSLDGEQHTPSEAARLLGLAEGSVIPAPSEAFMAGYRVASARWAGQENRWTQRLGQVSLLGTPFLGPAATQPGRERLSSTWTVSGISTLAAGTTRPGDVLLAVASLLLARLAPATSGDLAFRHPELAKLPGAAGALFASHVPLHLSVPLATGFSPWVADFLSELDDTVRLGGYARDLPLRQPALRGLEPAWTEQSWPLTIERVATLDDAMADASPGSALSISIPDDGAACLWRYDPAAIDGQHLLRLQQRLQALLAALANGASVHEATVLAPEDEAAIAGWNATQARLPEVPTVHAAFEAQVRRTPDAAALSAGHEALSYLELNRRANRLAREILGSGVRPGSLVGIMTDRSIDMVAAMQAVLKAGCAYVPLDPAFPKDRIGFMIEDAELAMVIAHETHRHLAVGAGRLLVMEEAEARLAARSEDDLDLPVGPDDLAYVIYTSGSTGRPKGVMLEHGNVLNFMAGMDARLKPDEQPGTWLAVTSISFDISVLELLWTLARGFEVVLYAGDDLKPALRPDEAGEAADEAMAFSLFYFSSDAGEDPANKYRLLLEGARFADENGFQAVWTPERHFHDFGGLYPNPSVTGAAIAAITSRVRIRAGSCVLPLHHPIRVAEEWSVVDNLSGGRVDISFASGWQPNDFVLAPENHAERNEVMYRGIETVKALWRGEKRVFDGPGGAKVELGTLPRPIQAELPVWVTAAGNPNTFRAAGEAGAGILTHMLGQDLVQLAQKVKIYREAWAESGHPGRGHVSLMLHSFLGEDAEKVREQAREPLRAYLRTSAELTKQFASSFPAFKGTDTTSREELDARFRALGDEDMEALLEHAFERYYETSGLFGTVEEAMRMVENVAAADVDEIACLIDFGIRTDEVLAGLEQLARLRVEANRRPSMAIPDLIRQHSVTHMQCTPSMAQMLVAEPKGRRALASLSQMLVGGEALSRELARSLTEIVPGQVLNMYGPTETTIWSSVEALEPETMAKAGATLSIGRPIANTQLHIFDERGQPLPPGVPGELVIGGKGVARGYWRRPEVTAERFLGPAKAGAGLEDDGPGDGRLYRTGDLARRRLDGTIDFLGRLDFQVKVRGHRIELGEIENALSQHPAVREAAVVARGEGGETRLVAYLIPHAGARAEASELRPFLEERLPAIMVPTAFVSLEAFPLTPNKKLDRMALPDPSPQDRAQGQAYAPPQTEAEQALASIWRRVLSLEQVGLHDDFFELGGNSLLAVFAVSEAVNKGMPLSLGDLLRSPTIAGLAQPFGALPLGSSSGQPASEQHLGPS